jgi:hypothetical protein
LDPDDGTSAIPASAGRFGLNVYLNNVSGLVQYDLAGGLDGVTAEVTNGVKVYDEGTAGSRAHYRITDGSANAGVDVVVNTKNISCSG